MAIDPNDGQFALECWEDADSEEEGHCEYSDDVEELRQRAAVLIKAGRYKYIELTRWNPIQEDWDALEEYD